MIAVIQRVSSASVVVDGETIAMIGSGLLALIGVEREDSEKQAERLLQRMIGYRIFADDEGRMNLSLRDTAGGLLLVPQFTLVADTSKGMRPGFSAAAPPATGERVFSELCNRARELHSVVQQGKFSADMQVHLVNDGPATFHLQCR